jgi:Transcription factor WhiB
VPSSGDRVDRPAPSLVPSFVAALFGRGREWVDRALCSQEPYASWNWIGEPAGGIETPSTIIRRMEVCKWCSVRRGCLEDALAETRYSVEGSWGGTSRTERQAMRTTVREELRASEPIAIGEDFRGNAISSKMKDGFDPHHASVVALIADKLEETFDARFSWWIERDQTRRAERRSRRIARAPDPVRKAASG